MPGPSSGVPINSMPAASRATLTAIKFLTETSGILSQASILLMVLTLTLAELAMSPTVQRRHCLAARI